MRKKKIKKKVIHGTAQKIPVQSGNRNKPMIRHKKRKRHTWLYKIGVLGMIIIVVYLLAIHLTEKKTENKTIFEDIYVKDEETEAHDTESDESGLDDLFYYYNHITDEDRNLYDMILNGVFERAEVISLPAYSNDKYNKIMDMILYDHPEIFWIDGSYRYTCYDNRTDLQFQYLMEEEECIRRKAEIEKSVEDFNQLLSDDDTEYDIIRKAYLYVVDQVEYVADSSDNQTVYSSLVNHKSVCAGYARAVQYLLQKNGIQALYVSGEADGTDGWDNHAWNIVRCNGRYYQVDATFGDRNARMDERLRESESYKLVYLCIDDEMMYRNHKPPEDLPIPQCKDTDLNYFVQNGSYAELYDEQVVESMKESVYGGKKVWCYQFANYDSYVLCLESIQDGAYSSIVSEYLKSSCQIIYTYDDKMYYIMCGY